MNRKCPVFFYKLGCKFRSKTLTAINFQTNKIVNLTFQERVIKNILLEKQCKE